MYRTRILVGDALSRLRELPSGSVHCCVTSPPYYGLRDYEVDGQIGAEKTVDKYISSLVDVFGEVYRVLRDDGTCWLNIGDSYASARPSKRRNLIGNGSLANGSRKYRPPRGTDDGIKEKELIGVPWMLAFALRANGWFIRQDIIWAKPVPMPEPAVDRCVRSHEYVFLLTKQGSYFFDSEAIMAKTGLKAHAPRNRTLSFRGDHNRRDSVWGIDGFRNCLSVWSIPTASFSQAHFATFPPALAERCVLAGTSAAGVCGSCGAQSVRSVSIRKMAKDSVVRKTKNTGTKWVLPCSCANKALVPATVLDPFFGAGTVGLVSGVLHRNSIGIELNSGFAEMAASRINGAGGLFYKAVVS